MQLLYSGKCKHKSQCQSVMECRNKFKRKWQTENNCKLEWRKRYDQELLKKSLEVISERRTGWLEFFQTCENNHENLISSFLLYTSENSNVGQVVTANIFVFEMQKKILLKFVIQ